MLVANQQSINLGKLKFGMPYNFTYTITNTGSNPVVIDKLSVGCSSCTKAHTDTAAISPGNSTIIHVTFTPGSTGMQSKNIVVNYGSDTLRLDFKAEVNG